MPRERVIAAKYMRGPLGMVYITVGGTDGGGQLSQKRKKKKIPGRTL